MCDELKDEMTRITRTLSRETIIKRDPKKFRRDKTQLLLMHEVLLQIAYDEGADITDGATDDEK